MSEPSRSPEGRLCAGRYVVSTEVAHEDSQQGTICGSIADLAAAWTMTLLRVGLAAIADLEEFIILLERAIWKGFVIREWPTCTCWQSDLAHTKKVKSHNGKVPDR